jgi:hypothetical protein
MFLHFTSSLLIARAFNLPLKLQTAHPHNAEAD